MRARLAALAVLVGLLGTACGGGERESVARYIEEVNGVQSELREPLTTMAQANNEFSSKGADLDKLRPRLARSEATIRRLLDRISGLERPEEAEQLHQAILRLVEAQAELAGEVARMAAFLPKLQAALDPVAPATTQLRRTLEAATTPEAQALALDGYRDRLGVAAAQLRALDPPPALAPARDGQLGALTGIRDVGGELSKALRADDRAALPGLIARFANAGRVGESLSAQRAQIAAVKAYNMRVRHIGMLAGRVSNERIRLGERLE